MVKRFSRLPNSFQIVWAMMNAVEMFLGRIFCSMIFVLEKLKLEFVLGLGYRPSLPEREEKSLEKQLEKSLSSRCDVSGKVRRARTLKKTSV